MDINIIALIASSFVWLVLEGLLVLRDKANTKGSTKADKMTRLFNALATFAALLSPLLRAVPVLNFINHELPALTWAGIGIVVLGFVLRHWSIFVLGRYFRTTVEIEDGQPVIQTGPYRLVRHPSYSGIILFFIGYGLLSQNWISLAACIALPASVLLYRINVEEKELAKELGPQYTEYQSKTKKLIPGIW